MTARKPLTPEEKARLLRLVNRATEVADKMIEAVGKFGVLEATLANMWADLDREAAEIIAAHPDLAELDVMLDGFYGNA